MSSRPASPPVETTTSSDEEWSREEEKAFETALADAMPWKSELESVSSEEEKRRWEEVAGKVGTKTSEEVRKHYETLVEDIRAIEAGRVPVPWYVGEEKEKEKDRDREREKEKEKERDADGGGGRSGLSKAEQERRKGIPWTEEEHKLFLLGLSKFGKGDWRSISRNFVISRTPTQVASHAQKYFIRLNSMNRDRRRSSIHDITSVNGGEVASTQGSMTGHGNATGVGHSVKHPPQANMPGLGMYGAPVGQPLTGHMVSAVGTPVMLPPGHSPYVVPMAYPVPPPPAMHQ